MRDARTGRSSLMTSINHGVMTVSNDLSGNGGLQSVAKYQMKIFARNVRVPTSVRSTTSSSRSKRRNRKFVHFQCLTERHRSGNQHQQAD